MLIEYVWIKDQGILKGQGVQFNPNVRYGYDPKKHTLSRKVNKDDAQVPDDFFHIADKADTRIARVTALVGANGTGKTAVLEFLASFLAATDRSTCQGIMVTTQGTFINLAEEIVFEGEWTGEAEGYKNRGGDTQDFLTRERDTTVIRFRGEMNLGSLGRYVVPQEDYGKYNDDFHDISDLHYLRYIRSNEIFSIVELIKKRKELIPFSADHLKVEISFTDFYKIDLDYFIYKFIKNKEFTDFYEILQKKLESELKSIEKERKNNLIFFHTLFFKYLSYKLFSEQDFIKTLNDILKYFSQDGNYIDQLKAYLEKENFEETERYRRSYQKLKDIFYSVGYNYTDKYVDIEKLSKIDNEIFSRLDEKIILSILRFTLSGLSVGEHQFLKLFPRLQNVMLHRYKSTIILLDGFETAFHPEWQRKFLDTWIKFWEGVSYATKVQVILATHSPYIVSDLPKPCVAFLSRKEGETESRVDDPEKHPATLGANLFELYQNAFFMKGALMGDLAKTKIDALFKVLSDPKSKPEEVEPLKNTIRLVGEPLIRMKLWELYYLKTNVPSERAQLLAQSDYIQKRLKDLDNDSNQ